MILTDQIFVKPKGIENGTHIVEYTSLNDLGAKIKYYLAHKEERLVIARQGRRVAMERHRSWHRMEEIIFGRPLTQCSNQRCPYIVHADEGI
jgi:spore maturation protein CgeB